MELRFIAGGNIRKVMISGKKITMMSPETGFTPITMDLEKMDLDETKSKMKKLKLTEEDEQLLKELSKLGTEEEMAKDIITDFQKTGWRRIR